MKSIKLVALIFFLVPFVSEAACRNWEKVGETELTKLWFDIYRAELRTPEGTYRSGEPLCLRLNYLIDISKSDLLAATDDSWEHLGVSPEKRAEWLDKLKLVYRDIRDGDIFELTIDENGYANFHHNEQFTGRLMDQEFSKKFAAIWLAEEAQYPALGAELRGEVTP
ncbi:hypothetical protein [uncultured Umboniibacter sp.]|uniref:chalcone isomerase family protein n=1 Tax=uncultured Umboniibacter sp. TaxID=1798917 RepID=UPI0026101835|nr:hypothetical protein [uncultured Umboniibacter sp.]